MGKNSSKSSRGVPARAGNRKHKFSAFFGRTAEKKIRNILRDHGKTAAETWAREHDAMIHFHKVVKG